MKTRRTNPVDQDSTAAMQVMVQYNGSGYHRHRVREISPDSAFVEMGNVRVLRHDGTVRLVFVHQYNGRTETHLVQAKVDEIAPDGARVVFRELDPPAREALRRLNGRDPA